MRDISLKYLSWVKFGFLLCLPTCLAAPQQRKAVDLGIYKVSLDLEDGVALNREINIDLPFLKIHRESEIGIGNAAVKNLGEDDDDDSDENGRRRKKRAVAELNLVNKSGFDAVKLKRRKRTPCFHMYRPVATTPATEVARRLQNAVNMANKIKSQVNKRKTGRRRRRQTEMEDLGGSGDITVQSDSNKFGQQVDEVVQKLGNFVKSVQVTTENLIQNLKQTFNSVRVTSEVSSKNVTPPKDAELI